MWVIVIVQNSSSSRQLPDICVRIILENQTSWKLVFGAKTMSL